MTEADVAKLFYVIKAEYPNQFQKYTDQDYQNRIRVWIAVLKDYSYEQASMGLNVYLASDTKGFPPSVGQLIDCIHKLQPDEIPNEMEAWSLVTKAVSNGNYGSEEEFNKLPKVVQRAVRNPARIKEWAQMDLATFQTVEQSNFMRTYRGEVEREKINRKIPADIRPALEDLSVARPERMIEAHSEKGIVPDEAIAELIRKLSEDKDGAGYLQQRRQADGG